MTAESLTMAAAPGAGTGPEVVLVDGDDASGLASMLADLMTDNLRDFPGRARVAARARGSVVMRAADHDLDVTLTFLPGRVEIRDGAAEGTATVAGPWLAMAQLCSGQTSPLAAWRSHDLELTRGRGLTTAAAAGYVLSVPASFYEQADGTTTETGASIRRTVTIVALSVGAGVAVAGVAIVIRRRRRAD